MPVSYVFLHNTSAEIHNITLNTKGKQQTMAITLKVPINSNQFGTSLTI